MSARPTTADWLRYAAIALLLFQGGIHLQQYEGPLNPVPTISTLFVLNAIGAAAIALMLASSRGHLAVLGALQGLGLTLGALVSLAISRESTLFDYTEPTLRAAVTLTTIVELAAVLVLCAFLYVWLAERSRLSTPQPGTPAA